MEVSIQADPPSHTIQYTPTHPHTLLVAHAWGGFYRIHFASALNARKLTQCSRRRNGSQYKYGYLKVTIIYGDNILRIGGIAHFARIKFCAVV